MTKVKICGITNIEDAELAAKLGSWAIGFIFYPKSPRYINPKNAAKIAQKMKEQNVKTVGVFVNEPADSINSIAKTVGLDFVQLHGTETPEECQKLELPFIKNIRTPEETETYKAAFALLVDASDTIDWGGTGTLADWGFAKKIKETGASLILSGGLSSDNIQQAITQINPDYVDLSSGLEESYGKKDNAKMMAFFEKIKGAKDNEK